MSSRRNATMCRSDSLSLMRRARIAWHALVLALLAAVILPATAVATTEPVPESALEPAVYHQQAALIVNKVMERYHYRRHKLDDAMSADILEKYLESLDPNRNFFLQSDIDGFRKRYGNGIDDALKRAKLDPAFEIYKVLRKRVESSVDYALGLLDTDLDFNVREEYLMDSEDEPWPATLEARNDTWRKRVKNDALTLRLSGKSTEDIKDTLRKRYEGIARRTFQVDADDVFQVFLNAYTSALEPHTAYMLPHNAENFDISMRLSLEGIGAVLRTENENTEVQEVVKGGPADMSGRLHAGDLIIGVAQGREGEMVDVVGWRLQDVVDLIRGPKGSIVRLSILPESKGAGERAVEIVLERDQIKLEEQAAKKSVIEGLDGLNGLRIGVITIPAFYRDFRGASAGDKDFRSTTRDVRRLLAELTSEGVDGVVIDLRDNGGGSLTEATELTGLFIESGPVVQIRDYRGDVEVETDPDPEQVYGGPLAVLVNRNSASASEIFSGAIQDYGRGIIVGEPTFGKGTVQQLIELGDYLSGDQDIGRLRLTIAQFFRVNGGSTQHRGVVPDVLFPSVGEVDYGERSLDNALPWDSIKPASFKTAALTLTDGVRQRHDVRVATDPGFRYLIGEERLVDDMQKKRTVSLNEQTRRDERERLENERLALRNEYRKSIGLKPLSRAEADDDDHQKVKARNEEEKLDQIQLDETARILADLIQLAAAPVVRAAQIP